MNETEKRAFKDVFDAITAQHKEVHNMWTHIVESASHTINDRGWTPETLYFMSDILDTLEYRRETLVKMMSMLLGKKNKDQVAALITDTIAGSSTKNTTEMSVSEKALFESLDKIIATLSVKRGQP
jgi:hypothetical protein